MTIKPHGNNQTWVVDVLLQVTQTAITGLVDFNVPGKPNPPPCNLTIQLWTETAGPSPGASASLGKGVTKRTFEFTDPTGTISKDPQL